MLSELFHTFLDVPFLLLPIVALFLPEIRKSSRRAKVAISIVSLGYVVLAVHWGHAHPGFLLEPTLGDWVNVHGLPEIMFLQGTPPIFIHPWIQILLTIVSIGGLIGVV